MIRVPKLFSNHSKFSSLLLIQVSICFFFFASRKHPAQILLVHRFSWGIEMRKMQAGPLRSDPIHGSNVTQPIRGQLQTVVNPGEVVYDCSYSGTLHLHTREDCSLVCSTVASRVHDCLSLHWSHL